MRLRLLDSLALRPPSRLPKTTKRDVPPAQPPAPSPHFIMGIRLAPNDRRDFAQTPASFPSLGWRRRSLVTWSSKATADWALTHFLR